MKKLFLILAGLLFSIHIAAQTTYVFPVASYPVAGDNGVELDADGIDPIQPNQYCSIIPFPAPSLTILGSTITGSVNGLVATVKNGASTTQDVRYHGTATIHMDYIPCDTGGHINTFGIPDIEIAVLHTFVLNGSGYASGTHTWPVSASCDDVPIADWPNIDYKPLTITDTYSSAWLASGLCGRECAYSGETVAFSCIAIGKTKHIESSGHCAYEPQCP